MTGGEIAAGGGFVQKWSASLMRKQMFCTWILQPNQCKKADSCQTAFRVQLETFPPAFVVRLKDQNFPLTSQTLTLSFEGLNLNQFWLNPVQSHLKMATLVLRIRCFCYRALLKYKWVLNRTPLQSKPHRDSFQVSCVVLLWCNGRSVVCVVFTV